MANLLRASGIRLVSSTLVLMCCTGTSIPDVNLLPFHFHAHKHVSAFVLLRLSVLRTPHLSLICFSPKREKNLLRMCFVHTHHPGNTSSLCLSSYITATSLRSLRPRCGIENVSAWLVNRWTATDSTRWATSARRSIRTSGTTWRASSPSRPTSARGTAGCSSPSPTSSARRCGDDGELHVLCCARALVVSDVCLSACLCLCVCVCLSCAVRGSDVSSGRLDVCMASVCACGLLLS